MDSLSIIALSVVCLSLGAALGMYYATKKVAPNILWLYEELDYYRCLMTTDQIETIMRRDGVIRGEQER